MEEPSMKLSQVRNFISTSLKEEFGYYALDQDDSFYLKGEDTIVFIDALDWGDDDVLVRVFSLVVIDIDYSTELSDYLHKLNAGTIFGKVYWKDGVVFIEHFLLGNKLGFQELVSVIYAIGGIAEKQANNLVKTFGGRLIVENSFSNKYPLC